MRFHRRSVGAGLVAVLALLVSLLVASPASADDVVASNVVVGYGGNVVGDHAFTIPQAPADDFTTLAAGDTIGPWTVGGGGVNLNSSGYLPQPVGAPANSQNVDLSADQDNASAEGSISQTVTTVPGQLYTLSFFLAGNVNGGPAVKTGTVTVGSDAHNFSFDSTGASDTSSAAMHWRYRSYPFTATSAATPIVFASTTPTSFAPLITGVELATVAQIETPIPEIAPGATGTLHLGIATSQNWHSDTNLPAGVTFTGANGNTLVSPTEVQAGPFPSAPYPDHLDLPITVSPTATPGDVLTATVPSTVTLADGTVASIHIRVRVAQTNPVPLVDLRVAGGVAGVAVVIVGGVYLSRRRRGTRVA